MEVEYLRDFIAYVRTGSLSKASKEVHSSPSTVSRHLASLERDAGAPLFDDRATCGLSPIGEALLEASSQILGAYDNFAKRAVNIRRGGERVLRIAYLPLNFKVDEIVASVKHRASQQMPACRIRLINPTECSLHSMLVEGAADLVITPLAESMAEEGFEREVIVPGSAYLSMRAELGIEGDTVFLAQAEGMTLHYTLHPPYRDYCDWAVEMFKKAGVALNVCYSTASSTDESLSNESLDCVLCFTSGAYRAREQLVGKEGPSRRLYRVVDECADGSWYAVWRNRCETGELRTFVRMLVEAAHGFC